MSYQYDVLTQLRADLVRELEECKVRMINDMTEFGECFYERGVAGGLTTAIICIDLRINNAISR
jgi:hypothetical protein